MKVVNFGSLNIDHVYEVDHFVRPGETVSSTSYRVFPGGKGLNQSVALARSGARVWHAGKVGPEGSFLVDLLGDSGANTSLIRRSDTPTGHAIIQVAPSGENSIVLYGGANSSIDSDDIDQVFSECEPGDLLLLQNEMNDLSQIIRRGKAHGMRIFLNPSPFTDELMKCPLELIDCFILNEIEAAELSGTTEPRLMGSTIRSRWPASSVCITLGEKGVQYYDRSGSKHHPAYRVPALDTTAAGDTLTGYFVAGVCDGRPIAEVLSRSCAASALCVTRKGASVSIPNAVEVDRFLVADPQTRAG